MSSRRHLLVVAVQCRAKQELTRLAEAAGDLRSVLTDDRLGACKPGLPDGTVILSGENLTSNDINKQVRAAIIYAGEHGATLVLAFLGHGFIPGQKPTLFLMAPDSEPGVQARAVNIPSLLGEAIDMPGINGVIGIIDTCAAAAGAPPITDLVTGTRGGKTRCTLLMAAAMNQNAYDLRMSRRVAQLLRGGIVGAGTVLTVSSVTRGLREELRGQDTVSFDYEGDPHCEQDLWLAHNELYTVSRPVRADTVSGTEQLLSLLRSLNLPAGLHQDLSSAGLNELRERLLPMVRSPERNRALNVVDSLQVAQKTTMFLRSYLADVLSSSHLRRAALVAQIPPVPEASTGDAAVVEHLALCFPQSDGTCRPQLARFVVALAMEAGRDIGAQELMDWSESVDGIVELNNAVEALRQRDHARRVRLIVSLHVSLTGDWPDTLVAWLLHDARMYQRTEISCVQNQRGVENALIEAVDWAEDYATGLRLELRHVDVAVPTALLLRWRPEEVTYVQRLGLEYEVVTRWSDRLKRSRPMARAIKHAARRLSEIAACGTVAPVDWLDSHDLADLVKLQDQLVNGRYSKALALVSLPRDTEELMTLLLTHSPIVLWPHALDEFSEEKRACLATCWHRMPGELLNMYRMRWRDQPTGHAGDLRAVWDDEDWLNFCRPFQYEEPTTSGSTS